MYAEIINNVFTSVALGFLFYLFVQSSCPNTSTVHMQETQKKGCFLRLNAILENGD